MHNNFLVSSALFLLFGALGFLVGRFTRQAAFERELVRYHSFAVLFLLACMDAKEESKNTQSQSAIELAESAIQLAHWKAKAQILECELIERSQDLEKSEKQAAEAADTIHDLRGQLSDKTRDCKRTKIRLWVVFVTYTLILCWIASRSDQVQMAISFSVMGGIAGIIKICGNLKLKGFEI